MKNLISLKGEPRNPELMGNPDPAGISVAAGDAASAALSLHDIYQEAEETFELLRPIPEDVTLYNDWRVAKGNFACAAVVRIRSKSLLEAAEAAKKYLEPDLVEPGRTVFWKLVAAIDGAMK